MIQDIIYEQMFATGNNARSTPKEHHDLIVKNIIRILMNCIEKLYFQIFDYTIGKQKFYIVVRVIKECQEKS